MVERPGLQAVLGAQRERVDPVPVALQLLDEPPPLRLPHVNVAVPRGGEDQTAASPLDARDRLPVGMHAEEALLGHHVPNPNRFVLARTAQAPGGQAQVSRLPAKTGHGILVTLPDDTNE